MKVNPPQAGAWHQPWSLRELVADLRVGRMTPATAIQRARARIAATEPSLRAWVEQLTRAAASPAGPLGGVPLAVKDIIDLVGLPTRCGTSLRGDARPAEDDALIVTAWRRAGAAPIGKTVTTEFAFFSPGPTRNPAALDHTPGGSSSGSAAAVAAGQVPLALGTQTAGSVTRPASYCGVASLVMSHGRFPTTGVTGLSPSLDSHGVFAARVTDLALAWSALAGDPDAGAPGNLPSRPPRILLWSANPLGVVQSQMRSALETARERLVAAGAVVDPLPEEQLVAEAAVAHPVVMAYEAARERAAELAVASELSKPLAGLLRTGAATPLRDYQAARRTVSAAGTAVVRMLATYDVILGPAAPGPAPRGLDATGDPVLSRPWQAIGLPVVAVPGLTDASALPLGIQLVGRPRGEADLLAAACWLEQVLDSPHQV